MCEAHHLERSVRNYRIKRDLCFLLHCWLYGCLSFPCQLRNKPSMSQTLLNPLYFRFSMTAWWIQLLCNCTFQYCLCFFLKRMCCKWLLVWKQQKAELASAGCWCHLVDMSKHDSVAMILLWDMRGSLACEYHWLWIILTVQRSILLIILSA